MRKEIIKIVLIGSPASGKSALLAAIWDSMIHDLSEVLTIADLTPFDNTKSDYDYVTERSINSIRLELMDMVERTSMSPFSFNRIARPACINQYDFGLRLRGTNIDFKIQLTEIPGAILNNPDIYDQTIESILQDCDTVIVAVDTPFLMHKEEVVRQIGNNIREVLKVLSKLPCSDNAGVQVIFVPLKCEYWIHRGLVDEVFEAVLREYSAVISMLKQHPGVEISIIPAETVGAIEFCEFRDAYVLINHKNRRVKQCFPLGRSNSMVVLDDGEIIKIKADEEIMEDVSAIVPGLNVKRPMQWFQLTDNINAKYCPNNSEQIILQSIKFAFSSILQRPTNSLISYILPPRLIGNLTSSDMRQVLHRIEPFIKTDYLYKTVEKINNQR